MKDFSELERLESQAYCTRAQNEVGIGQAPQSLSIAIFDLRRLVQGPAVPLRNYLINASPKEMHEIYSIFKIIERPQGRRQYLHMYEGFKVRMPTT